MMDIVAVAWEEHSLALKENGTPEGLIVWCRNCFEAGAEAFLLPASMEQCWAEFCRYVLFKVCDRHKLDGERREIVIEECRCAFEAGVEAQWMTTATTEELRERLEYHKKELRRFLQ